MVMMFDHKTRESSLLEVNGMVMMLDHKAKESSV